jgi:hypothetical protein
VSAGGRAYFAGCAALIAYALAYTLPIYARWPRAFYDPIARRWYWSAGLGPIPMGYVGQIAWGLGAAAIAAVMTLAIASRRRRDASERAYQLAAAWTLTALAIVVAYFTWNNWP